MKRRFLLDGIRLEVRVSPYSDPTKLIILTLRSGPPIDGTTSQRVWVRGDPRRVYYGVVGSSVSEVESSHAVVWKGDGCGKEGWCSRTLSEK